ncbi:MAG: PBP1A family penicillin-binding protein, partial [Rhodospirillaceae bacterium]|nr:PBP1A family penicillin-binding protein [Rhodospirillaceae bacterium]
RRGGGAPGRGDGGASRRGGDRAAPRRRLAWRLLRWCGFAALLGLIGLAGLVAWLAQGLPDTSHLDPARHAASITLLDADGGVLATYGDIQGAPVRLEDLPPYLPQAVLATEDRRFYHHFGIDPIGLLRALYVNLRAGRAVQGGSTITQQVAKNLFLTPARTFRRKGQELLLALRLEHDLTKDQILSLYLNNVYFGAGTYGVDAAARRYFGKPASQVTLYEAAMLAGLLRAPSRANPFADPALADRRARLVLDNMVTAGYLDAGEAARVAADHAATAQSIADTRIGRYFADWVVDQVAGFVGFNDRNLVVRTTLDPALQRMAEEEVARLLDDAGTRKQAGEAALVAMTPDGAVRAMVGGRDYDRSQFNRAVQARRQPGSVFKTFVYLAAMEHGLTPDTVMVDAPIAIRGWSPENYEGRYYGEVTLREAFARSLNSVAVQLLQRIGVDRVIKAARRLGIVSDLLPSPSLALGTSEVSLLELTAAYATFDNRGRGVLPHAILEIRDGDGRMLYRRAGSGPGEVVAPRQVGQMLDLMQAVVRWGTGRAAALDRPAAGKTGT